MDHRILDLIATVMDACAGPPGRGPGHPPAETVRVLATLRRFLREGTPWRSLTATADAASGSTLRRRAGASRTGPKAATCCSRSTPCSWPCCAAAIPT